MIDDGSNVMIGFITGVDMSGKLGTFGGEAAPDLLLDPRMTRSPVGVAKRGSLFLLRRSNLDIRDIVVVLGVSGEGGTASTTFVNPIGDDGQDDSLFSPSWCASNRAESGEYNGVEEKSFWGSFFSGVAGKDPDEEDVSSVSAVPSPFCSSSEELWRLWYVRGFGVNSGIAKERVSPSGSDNALTWLSVFCNLFGNDNEASVSSVALNPGNSSTRGLLRSAPFIGEM